MVELVVSIKALCSKNEIILTVFWVCSLCFALLFRLVFCLLICCVFTKNNAKIVLLALSFRLVFDTFLVNKICLFAMFCVVCLSVLPARSPK